MKVFYGICGEGMGHAGRSLALVERLTALRHEVVIFTFADGLRLLTAAGYTAHRIAGLQFHENARGGVDAVKTAGNFQRYLRERRESLDEIRQLSLVQRPDLFITDFEPLTALAAASLGAPCVSLDNQHKFCHPLESDFPLYLQCYSRLAGEFVRRWIRQPAKCIVAVFHCCPPSRHYTRVEALLRDGIARLRPSDGECVLMYGRGAIGRKLVQIAATLPQRFIAYGCQGAAAANIEFKQPSSAGFAADLAACKAVVCTAGQQLIGEAAYFRKPVLAIPVPNQHEQEINARYVRKEAIGDFCPIGSLTPQRMQRFLRQHFTGSERQSGVDQALNLLGIGYG